jgi:hypothetical protein
VSNGDNRDLRDALVAFVVSSALVAALGVAARFVGIVQSNLGALVAVVFLYIPVFYASRRDEYLVDYGFTTAPLARGLIYGLAAPAIIFPVFAAGFVIFYDIVCAAEAPVVLARLAPPGMCERWKGWAGAHWPALDLELAKLAFFQVIVVALPEELFFRGFLHRLLERAMPARRTLLGGGIGKALVLSSALFALGHMLVVFDPRRLAVFFPGLLFGWLRSATGSILAGTICHAASNLFIHLLTRIYF